LTIGEEQDLDVERAERVEVDLTRLVERRDAERRESEGERLEHEFWEESVAKYNARRQQELAQAWLQYHVARQRAHRHTFALLNAHHEAEIRRYTAILANGKE
jgi:hypothetical protein